MEFGKTQPEGLTWCKYLTKKCFHCDGLARIEEHLKIKFKKKKEKKCTM
jgi:hypothetical protein